ncbi:PD-(D/E)XK nuclease family transposase [compost metagenome]
MDLLDPRVDFVFKRIFGSENNKDVLLFELIDIEMQLFNKYDIEKRTLFYWSKRYASQLSEGDKYPELKKCVTINILNYSFLKNNQYHNVFHLGAD